MEKSPRSSVFIAKSKKIYLLEAFGKRRALEKKERGAQGRNWELDTDFSSISKSAWAGRVVQLLVSHKEI